MERFKSDSDLEPLTEWILMIVKRNLEFSVNCA